MVLRRPLILLSVLLAALVTVVVIASPRQPESHVQAGPTDLVLPSVAGLQSALDDVEVSTTFAGPAYSTESVRSPTRDKPQSKLWYQDGLWWGVLFDEATLEFHIWWLDRAANEWLDTGVLVDPRSAARQDVVIDGDGVLIVSGGSQETSTHHALRVLGYRYDPERRIYVLRPGFPAEILPYGTESPNVAIDDSGRAWVTFIFQNHVWITASDPSGSVWSQPVNLPSTHSAVAADQAAIVATADGVAVMWSNQNEDAVYYAEHAEGSALEDWGVTESALAGTLAADDHISLRAVREDGGTRLFAVVKTSLDDAPNPNQQAPQIVLIERTPQGEWRRYLVSRIEDHHTRPIIAIDVEHRELYIFATSPFDGGQVYLKRTSIDHIAFVDGLGQPVLVGDGVPRINNATTARQPLDDESGVVVMAADDDAGGYRFAEIGGEPGPSPLVAVVDSQTILDHTFDGLPVGSGLSAMGWRASGDGAVLRVGDGTAQLSSDRGASARGCMDLASQASGWVDVSARARLLGTPTRDSAILGIRGEGAELSGLRFQPNGAIAAMSGEDRIADVGSWEAGRWYRIAIRVDWTSKRWSFTVTSDDGTAVAGGDDLAWQRAAIVSDQVCSQLAAAGAGAMVELDAVSVQRSLGAP